MNFYLDASVVISAFINDGFSNRSSVFLAGTDTEMIVSDFVAAEFSSAINRLVRMELLVRKQARAIFENFDRWLLKSCVSAATESIDIKTAQGWLRRLDLNLRAPDAINLAIAERLGTELATFDKQMSEVARKLGITVAKI